MKTLILLFIFLTFSYSEQYTFLVNKYDKEIELEAEIISNIATSSLTKDIKLFIPDISNNEKEIYSKFFTLVDTCSNANFVFVKKSIDISSSCSSDGKIFFTNNYQRLLENNAYFGAFFWNKSRPNIIFIKDRLAQQNIKLPIDYEKFIEDIR
jgi:hypothetical protein